jgi:hypothetical protein
VFLSGFVFGIVYGRVLLNQGYADCQRKALHRVWQIYAANSIALLSCCAIVSFFHFGLGTSQGFLQEFFDAPVEMLLRGAVLNYLPWNFGILPLYMVILAFMPPMLVLLRRSPALGLGLSLALYVLANLVPWLNLPRYHGVNGVWSLNPFAWQLLFTTASALGMGAVDPARIPRNRVLLLLALLMLASAPVLRIGSFVTGNDLFHSGEWKHFFTIRFPYDVGKANLVPIRLLHFMALLYVGSQFLPRDNRIWQLPVFRPVVNCGQHSLVIFSLSVVLSYALDLSFEILHGGTLLLLALLALNIGVLLAAGSLLAARKGRQLKTASTTEPTAVQPSGATEL